MQNRSKKQNFMATLIVILLLLTIVSLTLLSGYIIKIQDPTPSKSVSLSADVMQAGNQQTSQQTVKPNMPSLEVSDDQGKWVQQQKIPIFRAIYDENGVPTVVSETGDKVIAPGTSNKYYFYVRNTGNVPLEYKIDADTIAYMTFNNTDLKIPFEIRLSDHTGKYLIGSENKFVDIHNVEAVTDTCYLSPNHYSKYTFEWQWPFESGDDALDTSLGDLSAEFGSVSGMENEIDIHVEIAVTAEKTDEIIDGSTGGLPQTGDIANIGIWTGVCVFSGFAVIILLFVRRKEENEDKAKL